jgi:hypothetical protein
MPISIHKTPHAGVRRQLTVDYVSMDITGRFQARQLPLCAAFPGFCRAVIHESLQSSLHRAKSDKHGLARQSLQIPC